MKRIFFILVVSMLIFSCKAKINENITIPPNNTISEDLNTINGDIIIGEKCVINGGVNSINGRIEIGSNSEVEDIKTVNGQVDLGENVRVNGGITVVNGSVNLKAGTVVSEDVSTVNGFIRGVQSKILGDVITTNGDVFLEKNSRVFGKIIIKGKSKSEEKRKVEIFLRDNSVVDGDIDGQSAQNTQILVYVDSTSQVKGDVINAQLVY